MKWDLFGQCNIITQTLGIIETNMLIEAISRAVPFQEILESDQILISAVGNQWSQFQLLIPYKHFLSSQVQKRKTHIENEVKKKSSAMPFCQYIMLL